MEDVNNHFDLIVVGAGPAGLMAAAFAAEAGLSVCVLEKNARAGMKLLLSGSGQCNLTRADDIRDFLTHYGRGERFVRSSLLNFTNTQLREFFHQLGVDSEDRGDGKVFPVSRRSHDVLEALLRCCRKSDVIIRYKSAVRYIEKDELFRIRTTDGRYSSDFVLLATGGLSYPTSGSTGDGYKLAAELGHHPLSPYPVLTPVTITSYPFSSCSGISFYSRMEIFRDGKKRADYRGDLLLTHKGFSGPLILNNSRDIEKGDILKIAFPGERKKEDLQKALLDEASSAGKKSLKKFLTSKGLPERFVRIMMSLCEIPEDLLLSQLNKKNRMILLDNLFGFSAIVKSKDGFNKAMATGGGIPREEVRGKTMASILVEGLYFAGEVLDIDGDTGGYNLQFAFSSGKMAADSIIRVAGAGLSART